MIKAVKCQKEVVEMKDKQKNIFVFMISIPSHINKIHNETEIVFKSTMYHFCLQKCLRMVQADKLLSN